MQSSLWIRHSVNCPNPRNYTAGSPVVQGRFCPIICVRVMNHGVAPTLNGKTTVPITKWAKVADAPVNIPVNLLSITDAPMAHMGHQPVSGGCTACPNNGISINTETDNTGTNSISKCYHPAGQTGSDTLGKFTYTDKCYY